MIKNIRQIRCENASTMDQREKLREDDINGGHRCHYASKTTFWDKQDSLSLTALKKHNFFPFYDQKLLFKIKRYVSLKKLLCKWG